jgi:hypothetical protein|tara:strand:- start:129 stop:239 length:111 start_codon:yes stop_codon:yes gene_type:complete
MKSKKKMIICGELKIEQQNNNKRDLMMFRRERDEMR